jgi:hypothetical protein
MESKIETLAGEKTKYDVYAPMVARSDSVEIRHMETKYMHSYM